MKTNLPKSSQLIAQLIFGTERYSSLLSIAAEDLARRFPDEGLKIQFSKLSTQTISICPMALCESFLNDINCSCDEKLLTGLGLMAFRISTHDDIVDETPADKKQIAELLYAGNMTYSYGANILLQAGFMNELIELLKVTNDNDFFQTQIISKLWQKPTSEQTYMDAIITTRSWARIGLDVAVVHSKRFDLLPFISEFADCYGNICQLYDDIREIEQDLQSGYYSLPISTAIQSKLDLTRKEAINKSIERSKQLADKFIKKARALSTQHYPRLFDLIKRIEELGTHLNYGDNFGIL